MKLLNLNTHILAYDPVNGETNNPERRISDWTRKFANISVSKPKSDSVSVDPSATKTIFSGVRSTSIDGTTAFDVTLLSNKPSTYRFSRTAGTSPNFRTPRSIGTDATSQITVATNNNATVTFTASGGTLADFSAVVVGDTLRISGVTTGDANGPFNDLNEGLWTVLAKTGTTLTCRRPPNVGFSGADEIGIILGASFDSNFIVYSAAGVQEGDSVEISAGFSSVTRKSFIVSAVAPLFFEVVSSDALPLEAGIIPTASGMVFYTDAKRIIYVEADQEALIRVNGMSGDQVRLSPFLAADSAKVAAYMQIGNIYSLDIVNKSDSTQMNVFFFMAE